MAHALQRDGFDAAVARGVVARKTCCRLAAVEREKRGKERNKERNKECDKTRGGQKNTGREFTSGVMH